MDLYVTLREGNKSTGTMLAGLVLLKAIIFIKMF